MPNTLFSSSLSQCIHFIEEAGTTKGQRRSSSRLREWQHRQKRWKKKLQLANSAEQQKKWCQDAIIKFKVTLGVKRRFGIFENSILKLQRYFQSNSMKNTCIHLLWWTQQSTFLTALKSPLNIARPWNDWPWGREIIQLGKNHKEVLSRVNLVVFWSSKRKLHPRWSLMIYQEFKATVGWGIMH